ncbi:hypothetical protein GGTG_04661 [Gaeumannomyces tritici R3-111a-1]|uniref:Uncharacterized protein n=1 Tax=Gaeumannomyces tritici (strain R3-111a-1) TaxID=644352 RepID=J3NTR1_GAET3|nr:hypothetical protein GGTG_04661 [Gaeumannomyces tritici R3-111a-1]EJT79576.1 hypothetical protein GGTG_04661 [Gaeumannomyces tritici R3-111a-1]
MRVDRTFGRQDISGTSSQHPPNELATRIVGPLQDFIHLSRSNAPGETLVGLESVKNSIEDAELEKAHDRQASSVLGEILEGLGSRCEEQDDVLVPRLKPQCHV